MDISAILPLLLGKTEMKDKAKLFSALASGSPEDMLADALPPEASGLLGLLKNREKQRSHRPFGLKAVVPFAPADIIGTLYKMLA